MAPKASDVTYGLIWDRAWNRSRSRWAIYISTSLRLLLAAVVLIVVLGLLAGLVTYLGNGLDASTNVLVYVLVCLVGTVCVAGLMYLHLLSQIMITKVVIDKTPLDFHTNVLESKALIGDYFDYQIRLFVLSIAASPLDAILRAIAHITLLTPLFNFWLMFAPYVFLEKGSRRLGVFWTSRAYANQNWLRNIIWVLAMIICIAGPVLLIYIAGAIIAVAVHNSVFSITIASVSILSMMLVASILPLFVSSFVYELYRSLPTPHSIPSLTRAQLIKWTLILWAACAIVYVLIGLHK